MLLPRARPWAVLSVTLSIALIGCSQSPDIAANDVDPLPISNEEAVADAGSLPAASEGAMYQSDCSDQSQQSGLNLGGISLNMQADAAAAAAQCFDPERSVEISQYGDGSVTRDFIKATKMVEIYKGAYLPTESLLANLSGIPGEEKVTGIARELNFIDGTEPAIENIKSEISKKYSLAIEAPTARNSSSYSGQRYTLNGVVTVEIPYACLPDDQNRVGRSAAPSPSCGQTISVWIRVKDSNPKLVEKIVVKINDGEIVRSESAKYEKFVKEQQSRTRLQEEIDAKSRTVPKI